MRITILVSRFPKVSEVFIERKIVALAERGHRVHVIARTKGDHALGARAGAVLGTRLFISYMPDSRIRAWKAAKVAVLVLGALRRDPALMIRLLRRLPFRGLGWRGWELLYSASAMVADRPEVVHLEFANAAGHLVEFLELAPWPLVVSCRGSDVRIDPDTLEGAASSLDRVLKRADRVHCVSEEIRGQALERGLQLDKAVVIRAGVDVDQFRPTPHRTTSEPVSLVSISRIHWVKGFEDSLRAVRMLVDRGHSLSYSIVGSGSDEAMAQLRIAIRDLGLGAVTTVVGQAPPDSIPEFLAQADIFLLASVSEGIGNALLEAMSAGVPVVVTGVGGVPEAVRQGVDGLLVPPRDPAALAKAAERLILDPELRREMGVNARQRVIDCFESHQQIDRFVELYVSLGARRHEETTR